MLASANVCPTGYNGVMAPGMQGAAGMGFHGSGHATSHSNSHSTAAAAHQYNNPIAFWQARQFGAASGGQGTGVAQSTPHSTTGATHQGQDAKMAEKIVSELQVRNRDGGLLEKSNQPFTGQKSLHSTAFRSYQCFSLLSLFPLLEKVNGLEKSSALLSTASARRKAVKIAKNYITHNVAFDADN